MSTHCEKSDWKSILLYTGAALLVTSLLGLTVADLIKGAVFMAALSMLLITGVVLACTVKFMVNDLQRALDQNFVEPLSRQSFYSEGECFYSL